MSLTEKYFETIAAYLQGLLNAEERTELESRIASDSTLQALVEVVKGWLDEIDVGQYSGVEPSVHALLSRQLKEIKAADKNSRWQRGITTYDSKLLPVPEGVRPATVDVRRIKMQVGDWQMDLSLYPVSVNSYEVIGQILDCDIDETLTVTLKGRGPVLTSEANRFHLFQFPRVATGKQTLKIKQGRRIIAVVDLEI
ncbi:MAG: hypothetical protein R3F48_05275 [Candidatus Zixiibacteriota bacterium]